MRAVSARRAGNEFREVAKRLRPLLNGRRVLLVGLAAEQPALKTTVRVAGACVMASTDFNTAISLFASFPIDLVIVDPALRGPGGDTFQAKALASTGKNRDAVFVDFPHRVIPTMLTALPPALVPVRTAPVRRPAKREVRPPRRVTQRRTG
jgi:hypothetical protein